MIIVTDRKQASHKSIRSSLSSVLASAMFTCVHVTTVNASHLHSASHRSQTVIRLNTTTPLDRSSTGDRDSRSAAVRPSSACCLACQSSAVHDSIADDSRDAIERLPLSSSGTGRYTGSIPPLPRTRSLVAWYLVTRNAHFSELDAAKRAELRIAFTIGEFWYEELILAFVAIANIDGQFPSRTQLQQER